MSLAPYPKQSEPERPSPLGEWQRNNRNREFAILKKSVAGGVTVNLTSDETRNNILEFSGALSANINVVVASVTRQWIIFNNTTGAFTLTIKPLVGAGIAVGQGKRAILYFDGTNVVRATADV